MTTTKASNPHVRRSLCAARLHGTAGMAAGFAAWGLLSACSAASPTDGGESTSSDSLTSATTSTVDDAYVASAYPNDTHGSETFLATGAVGNNDHASYLKFSVSGIPAGATGIKAKLVLTSQTTASAQVNARCGASSTWTGAALTWNNKPALLPGVLSSVSSETAGSSNTFDVSDCVTANGTVTLVLEDPTGSSVRFDSSEGGTAPALSVTYAPPAGHVAFGLNLAGTIAAGRPAPFAVVRTYHQHGDTTLDATEIAAIAAHSHVHTSIKPGNWAASARGADDSYLRPFFQDLKNRGGSAIYLSFHHEMDGDDAFGTPQDYVQAAQHAWTLAESMGVNASAGGNVYWVWTVTSYGSHTAGYGFPQRITPYYPGDTYVDFIGDDVYNFEGCSAGKPFHTFHDELQPILDWRIAQGHLKSIFLPEVGTSRSSHVSQSSWVTDMHADLKTASRAPVVALEYWTPSSVCTTFDSAGAAAYQAIGNDAFFSLTNPRP